MNRQQSPAILDLYLRKTQKSRDHRDAIVPQADSVFKMFFFHMKTKSASVFKFLRFEARIRKVP